MLEGTCWPVDIVREYVILCFFQISKTWLFYVFLNDVSKSRKKSHKNIKFVECLENLASKLRVLWVHIGIFITHTRPGLDPGFGFGGGQVERRRRKDRGAKSIWGWSMGRGVSSSPLGWGRPLPQKFLKFFIFGSQNAYFRAFSGSPRVFVSAL